MKKPLQRLATLFLSLCLSATAMLSVTVSADNSITSDTYYIRNKATGRYLSHEDVTSFTGTKLATFDGSENQMWDITMQTQGDTTYATIQPTGKTFPPEISYPGVSGQLLQLMKNADGSYGIGFYYGTNSIYYISDNGGSTLGYSTSYTGSDSASFYLEPESDGTYFIRNKATGRVLSHENVTSFLATKPAEFDGSGDQKWSVSLYAVNGILYGGIMPVGKVFTPSVTAPGIEGQPLHLIRNADGSYGIGFLNSQSSTYYISDNGGSSLGYSTSYTQSDNTSFYLEYAPAEAPSVPDSFDGEYYLIDSKTGRYLNHNGSFTDLFYSTSAQKWTIEDKTLVDYNLHMDYTVLSCTDKPISPLAGNWEGEQMVEIYRNEDGTATIGLYFQDAGRWTTTSIGEDAEFPLVAAHFYVIPVL